MPEYYNQKYQIIQLSMKEVKIKKLPKTNATSRKAYYKKYPETVKLWQWRNNQQNKLLVIFHYTMGKMKCMCDGCDEYHTEFLSIDHIKGGGTKERRDKINQGQSGGRLAAILIRDNFPKGFQILCHNCNQAKGLFGICPHVKKQEMSCYT